MVVLVVVADLLILISSPPCHGGEMVSKMGGPPVVRYINSTLCARSFRRIKGRGVHEVGPESHSAIAPSQRRMRAKSRWRVGPAGTLSLSFRGAAHWASLGFRNNRRLRNEVAARATLRPPSRVLALRGKLDDGWREQDLGVSLSPPLRRGGLRSAPTFRGGRRCQDWIVTTCPQGPRPPSQQQRSEDLQRYG